MKTQLIKECSGNHAGNGMSGVKAAGLPGHFYFEKGVKMGVDYFMTIKDVGKFGKGGGLEDLGTFGLLPLMEITKLIDEQIEKMEGDVKDPALDSITQLNRMSYSGLKDAEEALDRL